MSFVRHFYHQVFSPKRRSPIIRPEIKRDIYKILYKHILNEHGFVYRINGMEDHVHILVSIPATVEVATFIKMVKQESSKTISNSRLIPEWEGWQEGYSSFTFSYRELDMMIAYVKNQEEHHRHVSFLDEYRKILLESGVSPDDPFFPK